MNKLLLQWKGPYKVLCPAHKYNCQIKINGKLRTYHMNMFKTYARGETVPETQSEDKSKNKTASAIIDHDSEEDVCSVNDIL